MTSHRTRKTAVQAYRRCLERLETDAERYAEIVFEHQADLAAYLPPEGVLDAQLDGGPTELVTDLWRSTDDLTYQLAGIVATARMARRLRRGQRNGTEPDVHGEWQRLREAARRRAELRAPLPDAAERPPSSTLPALFPPAELALPHAEGQAESHAEP